MRRHCDGTDPNLLRLTPCTEAHPGREHDASGGTYWLLADGGPGDWHACACGRTFDDVNHLVIYPHTAF